MKKLYKFCVILSFPIFVNGQENTFKATVNKPFYLFLADSISSFDSDTNQRFSLGSRLFSIGSANKKKYASTYLFGASLMANVKNKIKTVFTIFCMKFSYDHLVKE